MTWTSPKNIVMTTPPMRLRLACLQCMFATLLLITVVSPSQAGLSPMENTELDAVTGNGGFSIAVKDFEVFQFIDRYRYCASDNGVLELQNIKIVNGDTGGPALFNYDFGTTSTSSGVMHFDIGEAAVASVDDWDPNPLTTNPTQIYRGIVANVVPNWDQKIAYLVENIAFQGPDINTAIVTTADLGGLYVGNIDIPRFATYMSPPVSGSSGFEFQTNFQMTIDKIAYGYNPTTCASLQLCTTYIGGNFVDGTDDPRNPASWMPNRPTPVDFGEFQIGDLCGDTSDASSANWIHSNPAGIDVGEGDIYGTTDIYGSVAMRLPMEGSIRFESATWVTDLATNQSVNFGPGAIDGIQVHRMNLMLIP